MSTSLGGSGGKIKQITTPNFTPEAMSLYESLFGNLSPNSRLSKLAQGDQSEFSSLEAPAWRDFNQGLGNIASRFSGMGTGARNSSGFKNSTGQYASNFAQDLQSNRMALSRQALMDLHSMSNELLRQNPYERYDIQQEDKPPGWHKWVSAGLPALGAAAGSFGGPFGMAIGSAAGGALSSGITGGSHQSPDYSSISQLSRKWS